MANKELKAKLTLKTSTTEKRLEAVCRKINAIEKATNKVSASTRKLNANFNRMTVVANKSANATNKFATASNKMKASADKSSKSVDLLTRNLKKLGAAYLGIQGMQLVINTSDMITNAENRLNNLEGGNPKATQEAMDKMYMSAQNSRMGYDDMMQNVSKSMTLAPDAFKGNIDNAIRFQEIMAKTYTLGGASAAEQSSSMYQMIQALGSGILQGDELRSVREGAPLAYKAIEEFAQGIYGADENLKDLASQGKITSDIVVAAMMTAGTEIDDKFENTAMTFEQAFIKMKNVAIKSFEPVLQKMNQVLNSPVVQTILNGIGIAIQIVAKVTLWLFDIVLGVFNFIGTHWKTIVSILIAIGAVILAVMLPQMMAWISNLVGVIVLYGLLAIQAIGAAVATAVAWLAANWPLLLIIATLAIIIIMIINVSDSFAEACGYIVGVVFAAGAVILNIAIGLINAVIQLFYTHFVEPFIGIIEWILNVCQGGFDSFGGAVANLIGQIISWFLSLGKVVTKIIDAIFGTNWSAGLSSLQDKVLSWGKNENAVTISREAPKIDRLNVGDSFDVGYDLGVKGGNWVTDKISNLGGSLGLDKLGEFGKFDTSGLNPDSYDDIAKGVGDTADNTGKISDAMELTQEDLEYLRRVADMEWKKEFTTAAITVDMSNYNTINGDDDLDGIVTRLSDKLYEEMNAVANGVYA